MLLGAQGLPGTVLAAACVLPAAPEGRGVRPLGGAPRACERRGAPGKPRCSKQEVAGGGPRPGREGSPQFHDVLARAPGRKPTRGLGGSPRAWLGPGSQGAAEGRVQRMAGHGSHHTPPPRPPWPPRSPHPHWPSQAQAGALPWAPRSMGGHGGREAGRAAYHTPRRRTLPMQAPGQGPGPGLGGGWKSVEAAGPTGWPSLPPSGMGRPVSTDACGAEPGRLVPCPSAPGFSARAAAGLWHSSLAPALAGVPGQRPEGDRPEPQARHRRRGKNRPALSPTPKAALDPAVAEPEPGGLLE